MTDRIALHTMCSNCGDTLTNMGFCNVCQLYMNPHLRGKLVFPYRLLQRLIGSPYPIIRLLDKPECGCVEIVFKGCYPYLDGSGNDIPYLDVTCEDGFSNRMSEDIAKELFG